ncbi:disease resistance protein SUMM2-like [Vigna angularis]|uniref:disease resistance protein SUMM2-like n=1 Tax=Phaseolus angularis TaxID=3914 RepID=UPI0022B3C768|nr:disease resistance protein SUMM2-like [Vigna angularis]
MDCLVGFASSVSRDLVCGALNQLRYLRSFNNFVKKLEQGEDDLIVTRDDVQKSVEDAKRKTKEISGVVDKWLQNAMSDIGKVNQLLEEARTNKMCCFGYCPNWIWRYRTGKKLANKVFDLEKFIDEGKNYVSFDRIATLPSDTLDILSEKCMNFESRQSAYEQLLDAVKNNDVSMIGLYGMGGCGKTTLAMEIRKFVEAEHLFEKVLFVPVSSTVEVGRIQEEIASSLQVKFPETEEMQRAQRLCSTLTREKNVFIILDDVWEKLDFGRIGIPSSEHLKGCKILITTRSEAVCTLMDCQRKIYLPILTDEEAWTLFQNKALISDATSDTLKEIGRLISNECKGLPVAIAAVACSLKGKAETEWRVALNKLRHSKPINIERGLTDPYKCQLSYDNLDTKEAKSLFLLCSVFPKDFEIQIETLTRCAIGLGVVGEVDSYEEARSEVIAAKIKLVSCCLLLDADHERVKMHYIVRNVAHIIAKHENKMIKCEVEKDVIVEQNSVRYLFCVKFPNDLDCSNLEFLYLQTKMKEFDGIFKTMGMLKVLILENHEDGKTRLSTISFKTLTNLRCLFIENYELSDFLFLGGMKNLQTLSLYDCSLPSFPELQTDVAIQLKLLDLNECNIKVKHFEVIKRIPLLEELYIIDIDGEWDANSEDNIEFFKTFSIPETLQRYGIVLGSRYIHHCRDRDIYIHGRTLLLNHFDISNEVIKGLAKRAKNLSVATIHGGAKNIIPDIFQIEGGGLDELNKLEIHDSKELECLIDTRSHSSEVVTLFSKLHTLGIKNMRNLRVIWHCFLPANGPFENLEKLYLSYCPRLTSLFTYVVARSLVKLKILKISRCDELKYILADDDKTEEGEDEFTTGHPVQIFQNLQDVQIYSCRELKHIFPANIVGGLTQLKVVEIEECDKLDQIIGDIVPSTDRDKLIEEELNDITNKEAADLKDFSSRNNTQIELPALQVLQLQEVNVYYCRELKHIFPANIVGCLGQLKVLKIERCDMLDQIIGDIVSLAEQDKKEELDEIVEEELRMEEEKVTAGADFILEGAHAVTSLWSSRTQQQRKETENRRAAGPAGAFQQKLEELTDSPTSAWSSYQQRKG